MLYNKTFSKLSGFLSTRLIIHSCIKVIFGDTPIYSNQLLVQDKPGPSLAGGAGGAIAPPTFLDLLNRYQFLPKNSNFFISTSTPKTFLAPPISKCRQGP